MPEEVAAVTIVIEKDQGQFRSVIRGNHGKFAESWTMWESHWGDSQSDALKKAAQLLADMPTDFLHALENQNKMNRDHPKVARAK